MIGLRGDAKLSDGIILEMPVIQFAAAGVKWWRKPLVAVRGAVLPAELAILARECRANERGVWINSRSTTSGMVALRAPSPGNGGRYTTLRGPLPEFVAAKLQSIYKKTGLARGCPDLVIWRIDRATMRLVEVKCPHWDAPTAEQERFMKAAAWCGIRTKLVEWEFR